MDSLPMKKQTHIVFKRHHTLNKNHQKPRVVEPKPKPNPKNPTASGKRSVYVKVVVLPWPHERVRRWVSVDLGQEKLSHRLGFPMALWSWSCTLDFPLKKLKETLIKKDTGGIDATQNVKIFTMHIYYISIFIWYIYTAYCIWLNGWGSWQGWLFS